MDYGMALGSDRDAGSDPVGDWRITSAAVGIVPADGAWASRNMAGEFRDAYVGITAVSDERYIEE